MIPKEKEELLNNHQVIEEINRHLWIESEKVGYDIGFEKAAADWLERFSKAWMDYHMPEKITPKRRSNTSAKRILPKPKRAKS